MKPTDIRFEHLHEDVQRYILSPQFLDEQDLQVAAYVSKHWRNLVEHSYAGPFVPRSRLDARFNEEEARFWAEMGPVLEPNEQPIAVAVDGSEVVTRLNKPGGEIEFQELLIGKREGWTTRKYEPASGEIFRSFSVKKEKVFIASERSYEDYGYQDRENYLPNKVTTISWQPMRTFSPRAFEEFARNASNYRIQESGLVTPSGRIIPLRRLSIDLEDGEQAAIVAEAENPDSGRILVLVGKVQRSWREHTYRTWIIRSLPPESAGTGIAKIEPSKPFLDRVKNFILGLSTDFLVENE